MSVAPVDVLMPCYERVEYTKLTLSNLIEKTHYPNWRLWIVDNGSADGTPGLLQEMKAQHHERINLVTFSANRGISGAVSYVWKRTDGYFAKIDNDILVSAEWLTRLMAVLEEFSELAVVGFSSEATSGRKTMPDPKTTKKSNGVGYCPASLGGNHLMRRKIIDAMGPPGDHGATIHGFQHWQRAAKQKGWIFGRAWPPVLLEHIDKPSHPLSRRKHYAGYMGGTR